MEKNWGDTPSATLRNVDRESSIVKQIGILIIYFTKINSTIKILPFLKIFYQGFMHVYHIMVSRNCQIYN